MPEETELITQDQLSLLKQLSLYQPPFEFNSLMQLPSSQTDLQKRVSRDQLSKSMGFESLISSSALSKRASIYQINEKQQNPSMNRRQAPDSFLWLNQSLLSESSQKYNQLKKNLLNYKEKSDQIYKVSEFIKSYDSNFAMLVQQKEELLKAFTKIKSETGELIERQKRLINLSMALKQSLDYYSYHSKNDFPYSCQISNRQLYEESLQQTLSTIMDGIEYFEQNKSFTQARKHLSAYQNSRSKLVSFIKSFYIKLLNKENNYLMKHLQSNKIWSQFSIFYPKSKVTLLTQFLLTFPLMKAQVVDILLGIKDGCSHQEYENQIQTLEAKQVQINEFLLNRANLSLIKYLQANNFQLYSEVMLNLFLFNRFNFHQNLIFNWARSPSEDLKSKDETEKQKEKLKQFKGRVYFVIQLMICEYAYLVFCCQSCSSEPVQAIASWLYKLTLKYSQILIKQVREIIVRFKSDPFELCDQLSMMIDKDLAAYLSNMSKEQYKVYAVGCVWNQIRQYAGKDSDDHNKFMKELLSNTIKNKIFCEMQRFCDQCLPKFQLTHKKEQLQDNINQLIYFTPKLHYCSKNVQNYMVSSLDTLTKSIKLINQGIQSRFQCYSWNLIVFGVIRNILMSRQMKVVSKQIRLDFNESLNVLGKVKQLQRSESMIKYAQQIFNAIKSGIPSLNELTLDFNKYLNQHCKQLQQRFLKDILFIYAKNMIQFLQKAFAIQSNILEFDLAKSQSSNCFESNQNITQFCQQQQAKQTANQHALKSQIKNTPKNIKMPNPLEHDQQKLFQSSQIKSLYSSYLINIEKYISESRQMLALAQDCKVQHKQPEINNLKRLIREVYEKLYEFLDSFYVVVSRFNSDVTLEFEEIFKLKEKQEAMWLEQRNENLREQIKESTVQSNASFLKTVS